MGWPSVDDWLSMEQSNICNHFHPSYALDVYILTDGSLHAAVNHPDYQPVSVAHDDLWLGGRPFLGKFKVKNYDDCPS